MPYRYTSTVDNPRPMGHQVNYGPTADLAPAQAGQVTTHYGTVRVLNRINQYQANHQVYVNAANAAGRPLTDQEFAAQQTGHNAPNASINHIIASGTGQNILNHETDRFVTGRDRFNQNVADALNPMAPNQHQARLGVLQGLAEQVASVARVQGYNRGIIQERHLEPINNTATNQRLYGNAQVIAGQLDATTTRNRALQTTLNAFQGPTAANRYRSYRDVLRMTLDSPGNLRVGDSYGNNLASTGFDAPTQFDGATPTPRAARLLQTHMAFAPDRLLTPNRLFSTDAATNRISSSRWANPFMPPVAAPVQAPASGKRGASTQLSPMAPVTKKGRTAS